MKKDFIKEVVKMNYTGIARSSGGSCCGGGACCGAADPSVIAESLGYAKSELEIIPKDASLGLGCGSPVSKAELKEGESVLDLGSGAGMDAFLAAGKVGEQGKVIGVDMTEAMIEKATAIAAREGITNVEFRLGEIENLPVEADSIDAVISNCVINLSTDKTGVFDEVFRVLKPGGRLVVSDIVTEGPLPEHIREDLMLWAGCVAGALEQREYLGLIGAAGFERLEVISSGASSIVDAGGAEIAGLLSVTVRAFKPA